MRMSKKSEYKPNALPRGERVWNLCMSVLLLAYGSAGIYTARMNIRSRGRVLVALQEGPAWLMGAAAICGALVLLSLVLDHYDRRNNEHHYQAFKWIAVRIGWALFVAALIAHLIWGLTR